MLERGKGNDGRGTILIPYRGCQRAFSARIRRLQDKSTQYEQGAKQPRSSRRRASVLGGWMGQLSLHAATEMWPAGSLKSERLIQPMDDDVEAALVGADECGLVCEDRSAYLCCPHPEIVIASSVPALGPTLMNGTTPLSSPGLTRRPSIPETFEIDREAAAYSIARSSRATTVLIVAGALPSPSFFLGATRRRFHGGG